MTEACKIVSCSRPKHAWGWCTIHYQRWRRNGVPGPPGLVNKHHDTLLRMCTKCGELLPATKEHYSKDKRKRDGLVSSCKRCKNEFAKNSQQEARMTVLNHYGGGDIRCECCGEATIEFMVLDHMNGDGAAHRKKVGIGRNMYKWAIKNNFPPIFRILCHNCNFSYGIRGYCPHQEESIDQQFV